MQEPLEGISFNFDFICLFTDCNFLYGMLQTLAVSINEMPAPDAVFVFIKISYKIFYDRFWVIRV